MKKAQAAQSQMMMNPMMNPMMAMNPFMNPMMAAAMGAPMGSNVESSSESDDDREREHHGRRDSSSAAAKASQPVPAQSTQQAQMVATTEELASEQSALGDVFSQAVNRAMRGLDQHRADLYNGDRENMNITRRTAVIRGLPKARLSNAEA